MPSSPDAFPNSATSSGSENVLAHGYAVVDDALVWRAALDKVPPLRAVLRALLDDSDS